EGDTVRDVHGQIRHALEVEPRARELDDTRVALHEIDREAPIHLRKLPQRDAAAAADEERVRSLPCEARGDVKQIHIRPPRTRTVSKRRARPHELAVASGRNHLAKAGAIAHRESTFTGSH